MKATLFNISSSLILIILLNPLSAFGEYSLRGLDHYEYQNVDAAKNARLHSNMGNIYFDEKKYIAAINEYEIAYNLTPDKSQSSVYLYNIARCFIILEEYNLAQNAIEGAILKDCMNLTYYETLANLIIKLNQVDNKISSYKLDNKNPYNQIMIGLIYLKQGNKMESKKIFKDFIKNYPDLEMTTDIKFLLNRMK